MKQVSIRELHRSTGEIVRSVASESKVVTDRGRAVALLVPANPGLIPGRPLPPSHWESKPRPAIDADSTAAVSEDRDR